MFHEHVSRRLALTLLQHTFQLNIQMLLVSSELLLQGGAAFT